MGRKELTFMEAVEEAKKGNKPYRAKTFYMGIDEGNDICFYKWNTVIPSDFPKVNILDLNSKWYIDEPEKTLSEILDDDKEEVNVAFKIGVNYAKREFREANKKFIERIKPLGYHSENKVIEIAKEIYGEDLI